MLNVYIYHVKWKKSDERRHHTHNQHIKRSSEKISKKFTFFSSTRLSKHYFDRSRSPTDRKRPDVKCQFTLKFNTGFTSNVQCDYRFCCLKTRPRRLVWFDMPLTTCTCRLHLNRRRSSTINVLIPRRNNQLMQKITVKYFTFECTQMHSCQVTLSSMTWAKLTQKRNKMSELIYECQ